ncbi:MAG: glycerophosphodiester phosphodiesterase family protein [Pseudomonadota bacterium]
MVTRQRPGASGILLLALTFLVACQPQQDPAQEASARPVALARALNPGGLRDKLLSCEHNAFHPTRFSIAHRGAPLHYPEHTAEGYAAAADMGAGLIECDVTFTRDRALVCRHSQCDLHSTTNILQTELAAQCAEPFSPAGPDALATARCCTSDITLEQFQSLCARADFVDRNATSIDAYLAARTSPVDRPAVNCGTLLTHAQSIELIRERGAAFIPELKAAQVQMPFAEDFSQQDYARALIADYTAAGVPLDQVHPQSFNIEDVWLWIDEYPQLAANVVFLDARARNPAFTPSLADMQRLYARGLRNIAPPLPMLVRLADNGKLARTDYARFAAEAGLNLIAWTFEAGDATDPSNFMYVSLPGYMTDEARMLEVLDFLAREVSVVGVFSDWPATVTYYANCYNH